MAISISAASNSASTAAADAKATALVPLGHCHLRSKPLKVSFALSTKPKIWFFSEGSLRLGHTVTVKAQLKKVAVHAFPDDGATPAPDAKSGAHVQETKIEKQKNKDSTSTLATEESISEFISQVRNLVKLVDSRDIVELQMKQLDCELLIRKKEAIAPTLPLASVATVSYGAPYMTPQVASPAPIPTPTPAPSPAPTPTLTAPKPAKSSLPPLKSPMAGTFYRSPAPGAPPFVQVGDKVQKGQVLCIVEAMKLMNEIEADQSGTIIEILAEDKKPVSFDTPLFLIQP